MKSPITMDQINKIFTEEFTELFENYSDTNFLRKGIRNFLKSVIPDTIYESLGLVYQDGKIELPGHDRYGNKKSGMFWTHFNKYEDGISKKANEEFANYFENLKIDVSLSDDDKKAMDEYFRKQYLWHFECAINELAEEYATKSAEEYLTKLLSISEE